MISVFRKWVKNPNRITRVVKISKFAQVYKQSKICIEFGPMSNDLGQQNVTVDSLESTIVSVCGSFGDITFKFLHPFGRGFGGKFGGGSELGLVAKFLVILKLII